jgi:signal transduction histidine kinase
MARRLKGGIRIRLLMYGIGVAIPLTYVGLAGIWAMWDATRLQLDDSIKKQAEISALAFKQWIETQREPLTTVATYFAEQQTPPPEFERILRLIVDARSHWAGLSIVDDEGETLFMKPDHNRPLSPDHAGRLLAGLQERPWAIDTDWPEGDAGGLMLIAVPVRSGGAVIAQVDVARMSEILLQEIKLFDQSVFSVIGPQGRLILYHNPSPETQIGRDLSESPLLSSLGSRQTAVVELESPIDGMRRVYGLARAGDTGCVAMVGLPSETLYAPARQQLDRYIFFSIAGLVLAVVAALFIAQGIAGPVHRLIVAARRFGAGDLSTRAPFKTRGEIEELRSSFNSMAAQIEEREARLTELDRLKSDFVSGVSHEMRTPLTTVKTLTRVLLRGKVSEAERVEFLETIAAECDRQIDLVLNLLDLSRIEAGTFNITLSPVDPGEVMDACISIERHNAKAHDHELRAEVPDRLPLVLADRLILRRVLCGLIENAIKYTPDGGRITLSAAAQAGQVKISVADTGRGILAEDLDRIFEKFYRGRPASEHEAVEAPGVGLGLYIARTTIEEISGHITVESAVGSGSTFAIHLPVWDNASEEGGDVGGAVNV